jgi:uncharacterized membrane protein YphA (DoxX/SURF4 family)
MDALSSSTIEAIALVARLCVGLFFLQSALGKIRHLRDFVQGTVEYRVLPERAAQAFGFMLPWLELGLTLALILGIALRITGAVVMLLLSCFIVAVTINLRRGREIKCNCYGIADTSTIGWGTVMRNLLLLLLAATTVALGSHAVAPEQWLILWRTNLFIISSGSTAVVLLLLIAFCFVITLLLEWAVDIHLRVLRLQHSTVGRSSMPWRELR